MASSFDDLTQPMTSDEVKESIYAVLAQVGVNTTNWKPGAVTRTIIAIFSVVFAAFTVWTASIARGGFLTLATGAWLKLCARYTYGVDALEATFATGPLRVTNNGGGVYNFAAGDLIVTNTVTGRTFRNLSAFDLDAMAELSVTIIASESGSASTSEIGDVNVITAPAITGVLVTNLTRLVGRDAESDPELTTRAQESLGALSPMGPWDAYSYAVKTATRDGVTTLGITRVRVIKDGYGNVNVVVATPDGSVSTEDAAIAETAVAANAEPQCINATVTPATPVFITPTYEAWIYNTTGLTLDQATQTIRDALVDFMKLQPIGGNVIPPATTGFVFKDSMQAAIKSSIPQCVKVVVSGGDVELTLIEVPVLSTITPTIHFIATPEGQTV